LPHRLAHEQENYTSSQYCLIFIIGGIRTSPAFTSHNRHLPKLFAKTDVTGDVDDVVATWQRVKKMVRIIGQQRAPNMEIVCTARTIRMLSSRHVLEGGAQAQLFTLTHVGQKAFDWFHDGITRLQDLPRDIPVNAKQEIHSAPSAAGARSGQRALREFLDASSTRALLDFETIKTTIPVWTSPAPYQAVPLPVLRCHIVDKSGRKP